MQNVTEDARDIKRKSNGFADIAKKQKIKKLIWSLKNYVSFSLIQIIF